MTHPSVTIGLNTFNAEDTVETAVASALAQDWPDVEIIVVDDCSRDGTVERIRRLVGNANNVRILVNSHNMGLASGRNRVIEEASGEFIVFFDDDDVSVPYRVRSQVQRILDYERQVPGAMVMCHAARYQIYPDGTRRIEHTMGEEPLYLAPAGRAVAERILFGRPVEHAYGSCAGCSQAARTSVFRKLNGFDPTFRRAEDTDLCVRAALEGAHFVGIAEPLVTQTMTGGSDKGLDRERTFRRALLEKHRQVFKSKRHLQFCLAWTDLRISWLASKRREFANRLAALAITHPIWVAQRLLEARRQTEGNKATRGFNKPKAATKDGLT